MCNYQVAIWLLLLFRAVLSLKAPGCHRDRFICDDTTHTTAFCCTEETACDSYGEGLTYAAGDAFCTTHSRKKKNKCSKATADCYENIWFFPYAEIDDKKAQVNRGLYSHEWMRNFVRIMKLKHPIPKWANSAAWAIHHALIESLADENSDFASEFIKLKDLYKKWKSCTESSAKAVALKNYEKKAVHIIDEFWMRTSPLSINISNDIRNSLGTNKADAKNEAKIPANFNIFEQAWHWIIRMISSQLPDLEGTPSFKKWAEEHPKDFQAYLKQRKTKRSIKLAESDAHVGYDSEMSEFEENENEYGYGLGGYYLPNGNGGNGGYGYNQYANTMEYVLMIGLVMVIMFICCCVVGVIGFGIGYISHKVLGSVAKEEKNGVTYDQLEQI